MLEIRNRRLDIPGAFNVRDLGGYPTRSGNVTAWRALLRAGCLHNATPGGPGGLLNYGVRAIIVLRSPREIAKSPAPLEIRDAVTYHHIPVVEDAALPGTTDTIPEDLAALYRIFLDGSQPAMLRIFAAMASASRGTILFNCTAGKDRTGVVAALLLGLADVERASIASDYSESAHNLEPLFASIRLSLQAAPPVERILFERLLGSDKHMMALTLAYLDDRYGGAETYLRQIGLEDAQVLRIKSRLIDGSASMTE